MSKNKIKAQDIYDGLVALPCPRFGKGDDMTCYFGDEHRAAILSAIALGCMVVLSYDADDKSFGLDALPVDESE